MATDPGSHGNDTVRPASVSLLVNIDVPDLAAAERFYCAALGLVAARRIGPAAVELLGGSAPIYLLETAPDSPAVRGTMLRRSFERHWTPLHLDVVTDDIDAAVARAVAAGATLEAPISTSAWGRLAPLSDPFGNGFCFVQFLGRGYDALVTG